MIRTRLAQAAAVTALATATVVLFPAAALAAVQPAGPAQVSQASQASQASPALQVGPAVPVGAGNRGWG